MSGSNNCVILFDQNDYGTYFTGQTVTGKVVITLNRSKKLKGIRLQIFGFAACQWRERRGGKQPVQKVKAQRHMYYGREDYIATTTYLEGSEHGSNYVMEAGTYTYTFACPIPPNCPSSYEGTYGHIRYLTKVTFVRNGASDRTHNVGFTVLKLLDLNMESKLLRLPASNDALENICFFHTKSVQLKINLQQTGYVPGQFVLVSANVINQSSVDCKKLIIFLNLRATYTSDTPCLRTATEKICLVKKLCGSVARYTQKDFAETIRVPATPPTCEHISKVVRVSYEICVIAAMHTLMRNPKVVIPITIGNAPLTFSEEEDGQQQPRQQQPEMPMTSLRAAAASTNDLDAIVRADIGTEGESEEDDEVPDLPPPTYEEAMFMRTNIADDDVNTVSDTVHFTPRYPVFNVDEGMYAACNPNGLSPPPNLPQKRRRKKRAQAPQMVEMGVDCVKEKPPVESPVQI